MSGPLARLSVERDGAIALARIEGEIDLSNAADLEARLLGAADGAEGLVLDLAGVAYIDSAGVGLVQRLARAVLEARGGLALAAPSASAAARVIELTGIDAVVPLRGTAGEAAAALREAAS